MKEKKDRDGVCKSYGNYPSVCLRAIQGRNNAKERMIGRLERSKYTR